jgi:hypothetical protein
LLAANDDARLTTAVTAAVKAAVSFKNGKRLFAYVCVVVAFLRVLCVLTWPFVSESAEMRLLRSMCTELQQKKQEQNELRQKKQEQQSSAHDDDTTDAEHTLLLSTSGSSSEDGTPPKSSLRQRRGQSAIGPADNYRY